MNLKTMIGKRWCVSTVRLPSRAVRLGVEFETMVFPADGEEITEGEELACKRYATAGEALAGHTAMVARWEAKL